jgi:hypothetical protein
MLPCSHVRCYGATTRIALLDVCCARVRRMRVAGPEAAGKDSDGAEGEQALLKQSVSGLGEAERN